MSDQHNGRIDLILQVTHQIQDLRLNGNVKSCGRLISNDQSWITSKTDCDTYTVTHTTGKLMRIHLINALTVGNSNQLQHFDGSGLYLLFAHIRIVKLGDLINLLSNAEYRVQCSHRLLENHGKLISAKLLHFTCRSIYNIVNLVSGIKTDFSFYSLSLRTLYQLHKGKASYRLSTTGFSNNTNCFSLRNFKAYTINGFNSSNICKEISMNIVKLNYVFRILHGSDIL